jgi:hypothetical protein
MASALMQRSLAGTMFELVKALNDGAKALKASTSNPISLNAGCELFIAFVTLLPHDSAVSTAMHHPLRDSSFLTDDYKRASRI